MEMVLVHGGTFMMGSPESKKPGIEETPQHSVTVPDFYMGKYEVTQAQWRAVMGTNPSFFKGDNLPVENVSWLDAKEFCTTLGVMTGKGYRLPTEAEWEYACLAGGAGDYPSDPDPLAWYFNNSNDRTHPVGEKKPNDLGLYDIHGNVGEWVADFLHDNYYGAPADGSAWTDGGNPKYRIVRGSSWLSGRGYRSFRCADRDGRYKHPTDTTDTIGFRVVMSARP
jgi:formylglycine-generating enzyme required for sulfatase activity